MKKTLSLLLTLVMLMTAFPVFAETAGDAPAKEDGGILSKLGSLLGGTEEGEESGLANMLGGLMDKLDDELDLSALMELLKEKLRDIRDIDPRVVIDALKEKISSQLDSATNGDKKGRLSSLLSGLFSGAEESKGGSLSSLLGGLLGGASQFEGFGDEDMYSLLGMLFGEGEGDDAEFDLDALLEAYRASPEYQEYMGRFEALKVHLNEEYATLEKGDVQVVTWSNILNFDNEDPNFELGYYSLSNFAADGTDLKLVGYGGNMELLTYAPQEDGTFKVVEAVVAKEGEGFEDSVRSMCEAFGVPFEDYIIHKETMIDFDEMWELCVFLNDNPQYERIEYKGEMLTAKELNARTDALAGITSVDEAE